jgi:cell cycle arrest protein BUB3
MSCGHRKLVSSIHNYLSQDGAPLIQCIDTIHTGSWDQTIATHDIRASTPRTGSYRTPERVYYMDIFGYNLVAAMAGRKFSIYDIRMMDRSKQERESSLRFMTGAVACMLNGEGASGFAS